MLGLDHPFFRLAWRRVATLVVCFGWGGVELFLGATFWGSLFIVIGAYAAWEFRKVDWSKYDNDADS